MKLKPDQSLPVKPLARKKKPKNAKVQFETVIEKVKCGKCCYDCNYWAKAYMDISCSKKKTLREVLRKVCKKFKISLKDYVITLDNHLFDMFNTEKMNQTLQQLRITAGKRLRLKWFPHQ